jgi:hypothetical protein
MKGSSHGLIYGIILAFAWRDCGKPQIARQDSRSLDQDMNLTYPKYNIGLLDNWLWHLVKYSPFKSERLSYEKIKKLTRSMTHDVNVQQVAPAPGSYWRTSHCSLNGHSCLNWSALWSSFFLLQQYSLSWSSYMFWFLSQGFGRSGNHGRWNW